MPYVLRKAGAVTGLLRWKPVDPAEGSEFLPDDDPEVVAFRNRPQPSVRTVSDMLLDYVAAQPDAPQEIKDEAARRT